MSAYTFEDFDTFDEEPGPAPADRAPRTLRRGGGGGRRRGGGSGILPRKVLEFMLEQIVEDPEAIEISQFSEDGEIVFEVHVAAADMGRVIGRRGRVASALRTVVGAAGSRDGTRVSVDIVD